MHFILVTSPSFSHSPSCCAWSIGLSSMTGSQKGSDQMVAATEAPKEGLFSSWKPLTVRENLNISARCREHEKQNWCRYSLIPHIIAIPHDKREELLLALLAMFQPCFLTLLAYLSWFLSTWPCQPNIFQMSNIPCYTCCSNESTDVSLQSMTPEPS